MEFKIISIIFFSILQLIYQDFGDGQFKIMCPDGMQATGQTWYVKQHLWFPLQSNNFAICVKCHFEDVCPYNLIEVCLSNYVELMQSGGDMRNDNCFDNINGKNIYKISRYCQSIEKPVCGLMVNVAIEHLGEALIDSAPIECLNLSRPKNYADSRLYDIDLKCPLNSNAIGLVRFPLKYSVLALICQSKKGELKNHFFTLNAIAKKNFKPHLFEISENCPAGSKANSILKQCFIFDDDFDAYCGLGLRWSYPENNNSFIQLKRCYQDLQHLSILAYVVSTIVLVTMIAIIALWYCFTKLRNKKIEMLKSIISPPKYTSGNDEIPLEDHHYEEIEDELDGNYSPTRLSRQFKEQPHPPAQKVKNENPKDDEHNDSALSIAKTTVTINSLAMNKNSEQNAAEETNNSYNYTVEEPTTEVKHLPVYTNDVYIKVYQYVR